MTTDKFAEAALSFTKSPLGIIALFIVLVYGFASLVVAVGSDFLEQLTPLIYFMVSFPVIVFLGFLWLVAKHHSKLYGPSDFRDENNYIKTLVASAASLAAASVKRSDNNGETPEVPMQDIVNVVVRSASRKNADETWRNHILWVDDHPENNIYERQAFEAQGIRFTLALSTDEALGLIRKNKYAAIISDMGRKEGRQEGYALLDKLRAMDNKTPFMIYAGSNSTAHKEMAKSKGAIGATNRADELFKTVMAAVA